MGLTLLVLKEKKRAWLAGDHVSVHFFSWVMVPVISDYTTSDISVFVRATKIVLHHGYSQMCSCCCH